MKTTNLLPLLMIFSLFGSGCDGTKSPDFAFIDAYLTTWTKFAEGANDLAPRVKYETPEFEHYLTAALRGNDRRAPSRFVYYAVVQVGGFIPVDSELGRAFHERIGDAVPIFTSQKDGKQRYFAGDLYFWWERHKSEYESFQLYDEWRQSEFAREVAIKMYESAAKNAK